MKKKPYSLKASVLYVASGLLHFIFMLFGYANDFSGLNISHMQELYSVYGSIRFGDAAIGSYLCGVAEQLGHAGKFIFLATLSTVFLLVSMVLAVVVVVNGVFGLIKGLAHINMTPTLRDAAFDTRAAGTALLYQISVLLSAICLLWACLMNLHTVGNTTYCVLPGLGMILLFVAAVVELILLRVFNKKADEHRQSDEAKANTSECPSCQTHVSQGTLFCPVCGVRLRLPAPETAETATETEPAEEAPHKPEVVPFPYAKYFGVFSRAMGEIREGAKRRGISQRAVSFLTTLCVILISLSIAVQAIAFVLTLPEAYVSSPMENDISPLYSEDIKGTQVLSDGYILSETITGTVYDTLYSLDGKTALMQNYEDGQYHLYLCRGTSLKKIADQSNKGHAMSADGSTVAYIDNDRQLVLYRVGREDTVAVAERPHSDFVLSPDGGSVLYSVYSEKTSPLSAYIEGETVEISSNGSPIALTNGGKLIYYFDYDLNAVCVRKKNGETAVLAEVTGKNRKLVWYLNQDHTEILFSLNNEVYYVRKGGTATLLTESGIKTMGDFAYWCRVSSNTLPINSFAGQYFTDEKIDLYYIGKDDRVSMVGKNVSAFSASLTGDVAYYTTVTQDFYRIESRDPEKKTKVAVGVAAYILSPDGRNCYYLDRNSNYWHVKDDCKPRFIASNVLMGTVTRDGYGLFVIQNPDTQKYTLVAARGAGKLYLIEEDVAAVTATYNRAYYFAAAENDEKYATYHLYASSRGLNFREVKAIELSH